MKPVRVVSLRLWLPLLVSFFFVILCLGAAWKSKLDIETNLMQSSMDFVTQDLSTLQSSINRSLGSHHYIDAWQALSATGIVTPYTTLIAIDDRGIILHAIRLKLVGQSVTEVLTNFDPARLIQLQQFKRADIRFDSDSCCISAYVPITLNQRAYEIRPFRIGAIIAVYDYSQQQNLIWRKVWLSNLTVGVFLLLVMAALIVFLNHFVTFPIQHLVNKTLALARGNVDTLSRIYGTGELVQLSHAFNEMRRQLETRFAERKHAEKALVDSEKKFRLLYNNSPDMHVSISPDDGTVLLCNQTLLDKTGYTRDEIIGAQVFKLHDESCHEEAKRLFQQFVGTGKIKNAALVLKCKDGNKIDVNLNVDAVRDESGKILYSMSAWRDVTEQKMTKKAMRRTQKMDALGQLTGGIAHNFNNLLGIILGNIELLELTATLDDTSGQRLASIKKSTLRATDLTRQLQRISKVLQTLTTDTSVRQGDESSDISAWSDAMSTGVTSMDDDHKPLLDMIHQCQQLSKSGDLMGSRILLNQLQAYSDNHLEREEALMATVEYPGLENHRAVHQIFRKQINKMYKRLEIGDLDIVALLSFLEDWWVDHIQTMDIAYSPHFQGKEALIGSVLQEIHANQTSGKSK